MDNDSSEQIRSRLEGVNVPTVERYISVGVGLAAAGLGVAASLVGPRRSGMIVGAAVAAAGLALIGRGVSGHCLVSRLLAKRRQGDVQDAEIVSGPDGQSANQGEGDRRAARSYNEHVRDFIDDDRVEPAARAAAAAIDGPEGPGLRAAEEEGKAPMKTGPV